MRRFLLSGVLLLATCAVSVCPALAVEEPEPENADRAPAALRSLASDENEEYNFSWLDPDKKIYVLQNRKYRKALRPAAYVSAAMNLSNPYKVQYMGIGRLGFGFTEQFGIEVFYAAIHNNDSDNMRALRTVSASALPFVRFNRSYYGAVLTWTPWYAKMNFFNKILYFDWALNAGVGQANTSVNVNNIASQPTILRDDTLFSFFYGTALNFFLTKNFTIRMDLIGMAYKAKAADNLSDKYYFNYDFAAGLGFIF